MGKLRRPYPGGFKDQHVFERIGQVILAANDVADPEIRIVRARCQMVSRYAVGTQQGKVFDIVRQLRLLPVDRIHKTDFPPRVARHAIAQGKRLSCCRTAVALLARKLAHASMEQPCPLRSRPVALSRVGRGEVAVRQSLLEDVPRDLLVERQPLRLLILFVPTQAQPLQSIGYETQGGFGVALDVGVVQAKNHRAAMVAGIEPVEDEGSRAAHMQKTGGRRSKAHPQSRIGWLVGAAHEITGFDVTGGGKPPSSDAGGGSPAPKLLYHKAQDGQLPIKLSFRNTIVLRVTV